jgi:hypothetical protein
VIYDAKTKFPDGFEPRKYGFTKLGEKAVEVKSETASDQPKKKKKRRKKSADEAAGIE